MADITIFDRDGQFVADSREVAEMTGVRHADLLEKIDGYIQHLTNGKFRSLDFFIPGTYQDGKGETRRKYDCTRKGCDMIANKMTGEKGVLFTAAYVTKFEEMERSIFGFSGLSPELKAIFALDRKTQAMESRIERLENNTTIDHGQQNDLQVLANKRVVGILGGKESPAYSSKSIRSETYSLLWRDFKGYFNINSYKNTLVKDFDRAREYICRWNPQGKVLRDIEAANHQMSLY